MTVAGTPLPPQHMAVIAHREPVEVKALTRARLMLIGGEKADGEVTFMSVFDPAKKVKASGPHMPDLPGFKEPPMEKGKEYLMAPVKDARPVPRRRAWWGAAASQLRSATTSASTIASSTPLP